MSERVYITDKVFITLCPKGQELHRKLIAALKDTGNLDEIYKAMQAYFFHRNGVVKTGSRIEPFPGRHCNGGSIRLGVCIPWPPVATGARGLYPVAVAC